MINEINNRVIFWNIEIIILFMGIENCFGSFVSVEPCCDYFVNTSFVGFKRNDEIIPEEKSCVCKLKLAMNLN